MKNLNTLTTTVNDGKATLDLPEFSDGTKLELRIISIEESLQKQQTDQFDRETEKVYVPDKIIESSTLTDDSIRFHELNLIEPLLQALEEQGYENPSPIQAKAIPIALKKRDLLAKTISIKIRFEGYITYTRSYSYSSYLIDEPTFFNQAMRLLDEFRVSTKKVRLVGVRLSGLKSRKRQLSLYSFIN